MKISAIIIPANGPTIAHLPERVPVTIGFDPSKVVGSATLSRNDDGSVTADAEISDDLKRALAGTNAEISIGYTRIEN